MHSVMHMFNDRVKVLHDVTPIDLPAQSAVLSDGVVVSCLHNVTCMCRGGLVCPPYGTVLHKPKWRIAVGIVQNATLGRADMLALPYQWLS